MNLGLSGASQETQWVKESAYNERDSRLTGSIPSQGDHLEEGKATHCSVLAHEIPQTEKRGGLRFTVTQSQTRLKGFGSQVGKMDSSIKVGRLRVKCKGGQMKGVLEQGDLDGGLARGLISRIHCAAFFVT